MNEQDANADKRLEEQKPDRSGARNLALLASAAILFSAVTVGVSLFVYDATGDIYLDRSRPGYIVENPDPENPNGGADKPFAMPDVGRITSGALDEFIRELDKAIEGLDATDYFSPEPLSDEALP